MIKRESIKDLDARVLKFKNWINNRPEKKVALVCHGTFISRIINLFLDNCDFEIWNPKNGQ